MGASWSILKKDKEMLIFPVFSAICGLIVLASFALPVFLTGAADGLREETGGGVDAAYLIVAFLFYFANYFVIIFFNAAIVACACKRMAGGDPTVGDGLLAAFNRIHLIAMWALVAASVGMILRMIEERSDIIGRIVAGLLGLGWTAVSFFVIPILVIEQVGPIDAIKESTRMLKRTWGEMLVGHFGFGLVFFVLSIPLILIGVLGVASGSAALAVTAIVICVVGFMVLAVVQSTLQTIFQAALYLYARDGIVADGFDTELLAGAMVHK